MVSARVLQLKGVTFQDSWLTPAKGAIERRRCPGIKPSVPIGPPPHPSGGPGFFDGMVTATLTVLSDGSVGDVSMVATSGPVTNKEMTAALKQWKFKPAMCGSEPVAFDTDFVIKWTH